jgi:hypothetical protein
METSIDAFIREVKNPFTGKVFESVDVERLRPRSLWCNTSYLRLRGRRSALLDEAGGCRLGGREPLIADAPPQFVGQLDFEELARVHEGRLPLPTKGFLSLFIDPDGSEERFWFLHYAEEPVPLGEPAPGRRLTAEFRAAVDEAEEDRHELGPGSLESSLEDHRIFWARHPQGASWVDDAISLELRARGLDSKPATLRAAEKRGVDVVKLIREAPSKWRLLWQLGCADELGLDWGDGGRLLILVPTDDLKQRRFDRTHCVVAPFS